MMLLLLFLLLPQGTNETSDAVCEAVTDRYSYDYPKPGDHVIGAVLSVQIVTDVGLSFRFLPLSPGRFVTSSELKNYQQALALLFAVEEINRDPNLLPNVTLGFHIYDNAFQARISYDILLSLLSTEQDSFPNFKCGNETSMSVVIGGPNSEASIQTATILNLYKIPQLGYGSLHQRMRDKVKFPFLYQMAPNEASQSDGIVRILRYFHWSWVGLIVSDDYSGEEFEQSLKTMLSWNGICVAFTEKMPLFSVHGMVSSVHHLLTKWEVMPFLIKTKANVIVVYGDGNYMHDLQMALSFNGNIMGPLEKVWITTSRWEITSKSFKYETDVKSFHGSLSIATHKRNVPGFRDFLQTYNPYQHGNPELMKTFWSDAFFCRSTVSLKNVLYFRDCTGKEKLETLPRTVFEMNMVDQSYSVYNAVYALAHSLHAIQSSRQQMLTKTQELKQQTMQSWELHPFLRKVHFNNSAGNEVFFNENMEFDSGYDILNLVAYPNKSFGRLRVGRINSQVSSNLSFSIKENAIIWPNKFNQMLPHSICSKKCQPGYYRKAREGELSCCYGCLQCPEGTMSDHKDAYHCIRCPADKYPNMDQSYCISKAITYLAYTEILGISLACTALAFTLLTAFVLATFVRYQDTPIVRANNRNFTYLLLISLLFCFLCSFLFIGQPGKMTCLLQQAAFGSAFSLALSCVLGKTITVVLAFRATNPANKMRKWVGKKIPSSIILICFIIQVGICAIWLGTSPPFPDLDMTSLSRQIILICNEGSGDMFYLVVGYMSCQAFIGFIVAFLARKLPDTFNEAKFITFSMLVFCSVWVSFFPSYLSTKGKYLVAVEIFAILASSAGLLLCIFAPKMYIILWRPQMNTREQFFKKGNSIK